MRSARSSRVLFLIFGIWPGWISGRISWLNSELTCGKGSSPLELSTCPRNQISTIEPNAFSALDKLKHIDLGYNQLAHIDGDEFKGPTSLVALAVNDNGINAIPAGTVGDSKRRNLLWLNNNKLTTLSPEIFQGEGQPEGQHPKSIDMRIGGNRLKCDTRMCWIKEGQKDGWLRTSPYCSNYPGKSWKDIDLGCWDRK